MYAVNEKMIEAEHQFRKRENLESATINISNLHYNVSKQDLYDLFSFIGKLHEVNIDFDESGRPLGKSTF